ncbi:hypothetical protein FQN57_005763 [Myotisia sp. PD_48]|nr:hypothetical protein FQN57_005763 [Myotisia sp. PD_48]
MPRMPEPSLEELVNRDNPNDDDYDDHEPRARRSAKRTKSQSKRPAKKRKRDSDDDMDDSDISEEDDFSVDDDFEEEDPTVERNARGVAKRKAAKPISYQESSDEEHDSEEEKLAEEHESDQEDEDIVANKRSVGRPQTRRKLILKLPVAAIPKEQQPAPPSSSRSTRTRARSSSIQQSDAMLARYSTRRSTRRSHDEREDIIALSGSGRHIETVRAGTRSPEAAPLRRVHILSHVAEESQEHKVAENEVAGSQLEVMESDPQGTFDDEVVAMAASDDVTGDQYRLTQNVGEETIVPESQPSKEEENEDEDAEAEPDNEEEEEGPSTGIRTRRARHDLLEEEEEEEAEADEATNNQESSQPTRRSSRRTTGKQSKAADDGSDFEPNEEEEAQDDDVSESEVSRASPRKNSQRNNDESEPSGAERRSGLRNRQSYSQIRAESEGSELADELAEEVADLRSGRSTRRRQKQPEIIYENKPRRTRKSVDYRDFRPEFAAPPEETEHDAGGSPSRRTGGGASNTWQRRSLFSTYGPFGGAGGPPPLLGGPAGMAASGGVDSDSSDDEAAQRPKIPGLPAIPGSSALAPGLNLGFGGPSNADTAQAPGAPANFGRIKDRQALADADPLGVNPNVNFDSVGGLQGHIDQLKEMVSLPLMYPEVFQSLNIIPPRGVLFHGPPGTGKTLLARALATSVSTEGRKVTFYMRKGADALSKWVGEAEKQLRLLFEEARKTQPSIIFFDEIDGLAPVRSSKQEQIHSSIVSTLLALMDGMDGRGQVIVIGATNRPDSVDPALRRPGRFDREFYFPLPNLEARRAIIDINIKGWEPPLSDEVKDKLVASTKGYGGADLRALCTEAALNAVQRVYPQIYQSKGRLAIDPKRIQVTYKDFMISLRKIVPSSERSTSSGAAPLPDTVEPLLREAFAEVQQRVSHLLPQRKALTALEEAQFEQHDDHIAFRREKMQQEFDRSRVFRPRLLLRGPPGMGQQYIVSALMNRFDGLHVQSFDLPTLLSDSTRSPEAVVVQLFAEVKRNKPSVIYIPNFRTWYETVGQVVISTFLGLLRSLPPTDPVMLLGMVEEHDDGIEGSTLVKNIFGFSNKNQFFLKAPTQAARYSFFQPIIDYISTAPNDFPDPDNRKKRQLEELEMAPPPVAKPLPAPSKDELKAQKRRDRLTLNLLKIRIQPVMDQIRKYKRFRAPAIEESRIRYLYDDEDPTVVTSDLPVEGRSASRPFEKDVDKYGVPGLREAATGKFFYNLEIVTIEKRLSNGYYKRSKDFLADIQRLAKDARQLGEPERQLKANELLANVEADIATIDASDPSLMAECENVYQRELERERAMLEKAKKASQANGTAMGPPLPMNVAHGVSLEASNASTGPVVLGEQFDAFRPPGTTGLVNRSLTNGNVATHRPDTGDESVVEADGDIHMSNSDVAQYTPNSSFGQSAQPRPPHSHTAPSQQLRHQSGMSTYSQKSHVTPMAPGSQPGDYANDASTTTQTSSGKKHSLLTDISLMNTESYVMVSARHDAPDLNVYPDRASGDEHLPDTQQGDGSWLSSQQQGPSQGISQQQVPSQGLTQQQHHYHQQQPPQQQQGPLSGIHDFLQSQSPQRHSQGGAISQHTPPGPPPLFGASPTGPLTASPAATARPSRGSSPRKNNGQHRVQDLLQDSPVKPVSVAEPEPEPEPLPNLIIDKEYNARLHKEMAEKTDWFSVEQLEQLNSELMDCIWRTKTEWDRTLVAMEVKNTFDEAFMDIRVSQADTT